MVPGIVLPGAVVLALLRFAVDLLVPFSLLLLIPRSIRDTLADWLAGERYADEPDPVWAVAVVSVSLSGTALGILWMVSTSQWAAVSALQSWIPTQVVDLAEAAEQRGWGQRMLLSGRSPRTAPAVISAPPPAAPVARTNSVVAPDLPPVEREIPEGTAGTTRSVAEPAASQAASITPTTTTLTTSAKRVRAGSGVLRLTVRVFARDRSVTGPVTFWDGTSMLGSARLDERGRVDLAVTALSPGQHLLTARFPGHGGYAASGSLPILIVVSP